MIAADLLHLAHYDCQVGLGELDSPYVRPTALELLIQPAGDRTLTP